MLADLQEWFNEHYLNTDKHDELLFKDSAREQIMFVRDVLYNSINAGLPHEVRRAYSVEVVGEHRSKSCLLPVYRINGRIWDDERKHSKFVYSVTLRYNFFDWKVSVNVVPSQGELEVDFGNLFNPTATIPAIYCEGFAEHMVYPSYSDSPNKFTCEIQSKYELFTFFWLINKSFED